MENSLDVLAESLELKIDVLREIEEYNNSQREAFENETANMDAFDEAIERKAELIEKLEKLDEGFEALYERVADEVKGNKEKYADKIRGIQEKIALITELSVSVQASEARNKKLIENYFSRERKVIKNGRVGSRAAYDYYKNMSGMGAAGPHFMDSKN